MIRPSRCSFCEDATKIINHLLDEFPMASALWEKGEPKFKKKSIHKERSDLTLANWPNQVFKNEILNRAWELFPSFVVWEIWKTQNRKIFKDKIRHTEEVWALI